ncbi:hypothetical protein [Methylacidimicrobium sp. AP8]|uniref:hypothetical protein n=1 Tax=Methylacidimicrobium sp. AP8 TaxID=2730359 RepID=UPI001F1831AF|nr:hypothetical protein [Methylacidimicrobium sp. AP8]
MSASCMIRSSSEHSSLRHQKFRGHPSATETASGATEATVLAIAGGSIGVAGRLSFGR